MHAHTALIDTSNLAAAFSGRLVMPTDPDYDQVRQLHNGLVDKRPALIARCTGAADVVEAVKFARAVKLPVAVRGGGHNVSGRASIDGGLMIDLSAMKGIHVDPAQRTVRAQGGVTWGEFNRETQLHGLACTGGAVSTTGIAGLTLGGGIGWLMGKHGLTVDNLLSVQLVTADAKVLTASASENPDLFWAVRGGGGNFGVAVSFEYRLHPVGPTVTAGVIAHPFAAARDLLRFFREFTSAIPDEITAYFGVIHAPDGSGAKLAAMVVCHCGPLEAGEAAVHPIKQFGSPVMDAIGPMSYCQVNTLFDASLQKGSLNYWKSQFVPALTDGAIDAFLTAYSETPSPMSQMLLEHVHGAVTRVPVEATAAPHRSQGYNMLILSQWADPADTSRCTAWARQAFASMQPFVGETRYVNYLDHDEAGDPIAAAYGPNYRRLQQIKARYDPENFFQQNQNIRPAN